MNKEKIKAYIGFAIKSSAIVWGSDNILLKRKTNLILIDEDLGESSKNKVLKYAKDFNKENKVIEKGLLEELTGRTNCKAIGITNKNLAAAIIENL
jgi:hypothetical protein